MNTQSHAILTYVLIRRGAGRRAEGVRHLNPLLFAGALTPDLPLFAFFFWYTLVERLPQQVIWGRVYFQPGWQAAVSAFHSFPLWVAAGLVAWGFRRKEAAFFCLAGLLASVEDFLLHHADAHAHFYPFSGYRFASPVSYWNPAYYGRYASLAEVALVLVAAVWVYPRLESRWGKIVLVLAAASLLLNHALWGFLFTLL